MKIEDDPIIGEFFDTPEKKARWMKRIARIYILWIIFLIVGLSITLIWYIFK